ncbi:hypothetical protein [Aquamicrobium sp. LC103]|uniref:hypothetical protein n=1 Tax=Aquamicrobium sp. LC103 TaxID=1120658 RepID=UPI00063E8EDF|nr:hypothetical protein [Aquamicrobium sp. LC103]TKT82817.1 hypothetical protein XW59_002305 [Aquamicrobium sp. LC103]
MSTAGCTAAISAALTVAFASSAFAACPIELAVYGEPEIGASVEFRPAEAAAVTNAFRMILPKDLVADGVVMWSEGVARPNGMLMHECPEGDVTGAEIEACTAWQGVIYAVDEQGDVALLPGQGEPAPKTLIFPDLAYGLRYAAVIGENLEKMPWDVFTLKGCQE